MKAKEISEAMGRDIIGICQLLLPNGKEIRGEWEVGSLNGESGQSLKVCLSGKLAGNFKDFASGEGGDLLDLWRLTRNLSMPEAMNEVKDHLNIKENYGTRNPRKKITPLKSIDIDKVKSSPVWDYLLGRGLSKITLDSFGVETKGDYIVLPYWSEKNELMMYKNRSYKDKKDMFTNKAPHHSLFGKHLTPKDSRQIVITEGEFDAMSYYQNGIFAVSIPFGAGNGGKNQWVENEFNYLEQFDTILLSLDMDDSGYTAIQDLVDRLGRERCFVVELPEKDANDCLKKGISLLPFLKKARTLDPEELAFIGNHIDGILEEFYPNPNTDQGMRLPWSKASHLLKFQKGDTTLWIGYNGHGKSQVLGHIMINGMSHGYKFAVASMEFTYEQLLYRFIRQITGKAKPSHGEIYAASAWFAETAHVFNASGSSKGKRILEVFKYCKERYGVEHFIIDSLAKCGLSPQDFEGQSRFLDQVSDFARVNKIHIHVVCHCRKPDNEIYIPNRYQILGSSDISNYADNIIAVWRNKPKENPGKYAHSMPSKFNIPEFDCMLDLDKVRGVDSEEGGFGLHFDKESLQYGEYQDFTPRRYA